MVLTKNRVTVIDRGNGEQKRWKTADIYAFGNDASQRKITREGFMVVPAKISRTGIQEYDAIELGIEGTNRIIRLLRPPSEVFSEKSMASFERQTFTSNHPTGDVNADNWREVSRGDVHDVKPFGDNVHVAGTVIVRDAECIRVVAAGKEQLSCGYDFVLDMTPGVTAEGEAFDGVMRDIRGNHVALVWEGRAGAGVRVADRDPNDTNKEKPMPAIRMIDSIQVTFAEERDATVVDRELKKLGDALVVVKTGADKLTTDLNAANTLITELKQAAADAKARHEAELATANGKVLAEDALDKLIDARFALIGDARLVMGDSFEAKGKNDLAIRQAVLEHVVANDSAGKLVVEKFLKGADLAAVVKANPSLIGYAFDAVVATVGVRSASDGASSRLEIGSVIGATDSAAGSGQPGVRKAYDDKEQVGSAGLEQLMQSGGSTPAART